MIYVNINRFKEGARVLEDIARFVLKDKDLFNRIKLIKYSINSFNIDYTRSIISSNHINDIGDESYIENNYKNNLLDLIEANSRRMQESSRVLEEITNNNFFKKLRFDSYRVYNILISKINNYLRLDKLRGLYILANPEKVELKHIVKTINNTRSNIVQLRMKKSSKKKIYNYAIELKNNLDKNKVLIINDYIDIALAIADGVHLGQNDTPIKVARKISPDNFIIGITCHNLDEAKRAESLGASYISVGCIFETRTKLDTISVSIGELDRIRQNIKIPVCAIGGINNNNLVGIKKLNIDMWAMYSEIWQEYLF